MKLFRYLGNKLNVLLIFKSKIGTKESHFYDVYVKGGGVLENCQVLPDSIVFKQ